MANFNIMFCISLLLQFCVKIIAVCILCEYKMRWKLLFGGFVLRSNVSSFKKPAGWYIYILYKIRSTRFTQIHLLFWWKFSSFSPPYFSTFFFPLLFTLFMCLLKFIFSLQLSLSKAQFYRTFWAIFYLQQISGKIRSTQNKIIN